MKVYKFNPRQDWKNAPDYRAVAPLHIRDNLWESFSPVGAAEYTSEDGETKSYPYEILSKAVLPKDLTAFLQELEDTGDPIIFMQYCQWARTPFFDGKEYKIRVRYAKLPSEL